MMEKEGMVLSQMEEFCYIIKEKKNSKGIDGAKKNDIDVG